MGNRTPHRSRTFRTGLAAAAAGTLLAVTGLAVAPVSASVEDPTPTPYAGNPSCATYGHAVELKIDVQPVAGTYDADHDDVEVVGALPEGASVTISDVELVDGRLQFDWTSTHAWDLVLVKQANGGLAYEYDPAVAADQDVQTVAGQNSGGISHVTFCGPSTPPTSEETDLCPEEGVQTSLPCEEVEETDLCPEEGVQTSLPCEEVEETDLCPEEGVQTSLPCEEVEETDLCPEEGVQTSLPCEEVEETDLCPEEGVQTSLPCEEVEETDLCPEEGVQTSLPCQEVEATDLCEDVPGDQTQLPCPQDACPEVADFQATDEACPAVLIPPVVIENLPPQAQAPEVVPTVVPGPRRPTQVAGIQVLPAAQELPRTGVDTGTWVQLGLGLVLAGAGAMVAARRPDEATAR